MQKPDADQTRSTLLLLAIAYIGFISLGLPDPAAGVAWPSVRDKFTLSQSAFGLVFIGLGCGYCLSGFFGGKLTHLLGLGNLLWLSSAFVAVAMFGSGLAPAWPVFVAWAVIWGLGSGGIDAGLNAYASRHFSARHMNWLHACYCLGAALGPLLMTAMILLAHSWRLGYAAVGSVMSLMSLLFLVTRRRWTDSPQTSGEQSESGQAQPPLGMTAALREPLVWLQALLFFIYVGLEFTVGQWCFTVLTESRNVGAEIAGTLASSYYAAIGIGRVLAGTITARVGLDRLVRGSMLTALAGTAVFTVAAPVEASFAGLAIIGLGLAPIFPCLMASTPQRLGADVATHAVGFQVSAGMVGASLAPGAAGLLAEQFGLEVVARFAVLLATLLFVVHELLLVSTRRNAPSSMPPIHKP